MGTFVLGLAWAFFALMGMSFGVAMWFDGWRDFLRSL